MIRSTGQFDLRLMVTGIDLLSFFDSTTTFSHLSCSKHAPLNWSIYSSINSITGIDLLPFLDSATTFSHLACSKRIPQSKNSGTFDLIHSTSNFFHIFMRSEPLFRKWLTGQTGTNKKSEGAMSYEYDGWNQFSNPIILNMAEPVLRCMTQGGFNGRCFYLY